MRIYYRVRGENGQVVEGEMEAPSRLEALKDLASRGWHVDYCDDRPPPRRQRETEPRQAVVIFPELLFFRPWPGHLANFYHQLGQLLSAGVTPHEVAETLARRAPSPRLRQVMAALSSDLAAGASLSEGLARYPQLFPPDAAGLLRAADHTGDWPAICRELEEWYTRLYKGLLWILVARVYYIAVLLVAVLVPYFPYFLTRGMGWYVNFVITRLAPAIGAAVVLWLAWRAVWALPAARPLRDRLVLLMPIARGYELRAAALRFFQALHSLLRAGLNAGEALAIAADATGNSILASRVKDAAEALRRGAAVEDVAMGLPFLSAQQRATLATAFQSGRLEDGLARLANEARDQTTVRLWQVRLATVGTGIVIVTVIAAIAIIVGWLNLYAAIAERAGVGDIWQELRQ